MLFSTTGMIHLSVNPAYITFGAPSDLGLLLFTVPNSVYYPGSVQTVPFLSRKMLRLFSTHRKNIYR